MNKIVAYIVKSLRDCGCTGANKLFSKCTPLSVVIAFTPRFLGGASCPNFYSIVRGHVTFVNDPGQDSLLPS